MDQFLAAAIDEARKGPAAGGIPIGSVLVVDGVIVGRGHDQRVDVTVVGHPTCDARPELWNEDIGE